MFLSKKPDPINFFDWVIRNELDMIDSDSNEFFENHRCCLAISKLVTKLKSKNDGEFFSF
jgi:hypothetical protein